MINQLYILLFNTAIAFYGLNFLGFNLGKKSKKARIVVVVLFGIFLLLAELYFFEISRE
jgi:hypothetical protein